MQLLIAGHGVLDRHASRLASWRGGFVGRFWCVGCRRRPNPIEGSAEAHEVHDPTPRLAGVNLGIEPGDPMVLVQLVPVELTRCADIPRSQVPAESRFARLCGLLARRACRC